MKQVVQGSPEKVRNRRRRYKPPVDQTSVRTDAVEYVQSATGNYFLPRDARGDLIATAIREGRVFGEEMVTVARRVTSSPGVWCSTSAQTSVR